MTIDSRFTVLAHRVRLGQFLSVGAVGAAIETVIVALLTALFGVGPLLAKAVGAEVSISTMFAINDRWTFSREGRPDIRAVVQRWVKSNLVRSVGLLVSFSILYLLTHSTDYSVVLLNADLWPTLANLIGISTAMVVNYTAESLFTWRV
ncbi:GtrA family protein [Halococcus sp. IIIV-5B]|uniref:GtrA family protein n=1 Tax=Halococcus sp. IIIV-5B TaxID=2321230 RepID=UPI0013143B19|nr:GtrA family protein [Halococcus sp. IIIV-5B]